MVSAVSTDESHRNIKKVPTDWLFGAVCHLCPDIPLVGHNVLCMGAAATTNYPLQTSAGCYFTHTNTHHFGAITCSTPKHTHINRLRTVSKRPSLAITTVMVSQ